MDNKSKLSVVVILYPGCIFFEMALVIELLAEKYQIVFATPDGSDHDASNGSLVRANTSYLNIDLTNCRAILIPGGDPELIKDNKIIFDVIQSANDKELWLAAICAGPLVLAKASVLRGKKIAHGYNSKQLEFLQSYFDGVQITEEKFICDGNIITAKPDAYIDFAVEIACRLSVVEASKANRIKDYYRGILGIKIRPLALALIRNSKGQYLFHKGYDKIKNENFYRPLGGGIEFSESGRIAVEREIMEELNQEVNVSEIIASFENIFIFDGRPGHEIIMLFSAEFRNEDVYQQQELDIYESGVLISKAVWRSVSEIKSEGAKIFPNGLERFL